LNAEDAESETKKIGLVERNNRRGEIGN